jgi:hypothetical protein
MLAGALRAAEISRSLRFLQTGFSISGHVPLAETGAACAAAANGGLVSASGGMGLWDLVACA